MSSGEGNCSGKEGEGTARRSGNWLGMKIQTHAKIGAKTFMNVSIVNSENFFFFNYFLPADEKRQLCQFEK